MKIDLTKIEDDLQEIFEKVGQFNEPTLVVYWADTNGPKETVPSLDMKLISGPTRIGATDEYRFNEVTAKHEIHGLREFTLSVNAYGKTSHQILSDIQTHFENPFVVDFMLSKNISVMSKNDIDNLSQLQETITEQRHHMDVIFNIGFTIEIVDITAVPAGAPLESIENVSGTFDFGLGVQEFEINTP
jgi:hypothetical protein